MSQLTPNVPIWRPSRQTRIGIQDFVVMHGGPNAMRLPEHEHDEIQIQAHFSPIALSRDSPAALPDTYHLIPSRMPHIGSWNEGSEVIVFLLHTQQLEMASDELLHRPRYELEEEICGVDPLIHSVASALRREFLSGTSDPLFLQALRTVLSGHLVRSFGSSHARPLRGRLSPRLLRRVLDLIEEKLGGDLSLEDLANACGIGTHRFAQLFKASTGLSPYRYVTSLRIARAKELLAMTSLAPIEIAHRLGFASQSHFSTSFRQHTQFTPQRYRRSVRGERAVKKT